ncbi:endolytic transglycosylase MltG [Patescibacteria group bacterium]|nr:endolytic transglycosylase MltG [Patescibacteria group bacterium]
MKLRWIFLCLVLITAPVLVWFRFIAPVGSDTNLQIISFQNDTPKLLAASRLREQGYVRSSTALELILDKNIAAGGYNLSKSMNVFEIAKALRNPEYLWVTVAPGMRKEQIAEKMKDKFNWTQADLDGFLSFPEGEYFPDTYLISKTDGGKAAGQKMFDHFNEKFAPLAPEFLAQNIKNDTAIKIASLIQREAGGKDDMPLIAGIIWNRLLKGMLLQIDASNQYAKGSSGNWWPPVYGSDLKDDNPYNLYIYKGLPPTAISNPGLPAIEAVLNPTETDCLFYLHDKAKQIHCSVTYEEHLENIKKYLN